MWEKGGAGSCPSQQGAWWVRISSGAACLLSKGSVICLTPFPAVAICSGQCVTENIPDLMRALNKL